MEMRKLQILTGEFNALLRWVLWGVQGTLIVAAVFGICGAMWCEGARKVHLGVVAVACISFIAVIYTKLASILDDSSETLVQWRHCRDQKAWMSRFLRSMPPIRVRIGAYFYADKAIVLTSLGIVVDNAVSLVVSRRV